MRYLFLLLFLAGCAGQYSADPRVAEIQKWAEACNQMGQAIKTATLLGRAGSLTESEARIIDQVDLIYRPVCTGDPGPLTEVLQDEAVKRAVSEFCPTLTATDNLGITAAQVAACVARKQLIQQLQTEAL